MMISKPNIIQSPNTTFGKITRDAPLPPRRSPPRRSPPRRSPPRRNERSWSPSGSKDTCDARNDRNAYGPFTWGIREAPFPLGLEKPPHMESYDGTTGMDEHIEAVHTYRSVHLHRQMQAFRHYSEARSYHLVQELKEKLHRFMERPLLRIHDPFHYYKDGADERMKQYLIAKGLCEGTNVKKVVFLDRPRTLNKFLVIAKIYIAYEEELYADNVNKSRKEESAAESSKMPFHEKKKEGKATREGKRPNDYFTEYTPLAMSRKKILAEIVVADLTEADIKPPKAPSQERKGVDKRKYYRFHKCHGHTTDDYIHLKDAIELLIQRGRLKQFVKNPKAERKTVELVVDGSEPGKAVSMSVKHLGDFPDNLETTPYSCTWEQFPSANVITGGTLNVSMGSMKRNFEELMSVNLLAPSNHGGRPPLAFYDSELPCRASNSAIPLLTWGYIELLFTFGEKEAKRTIKISFLVIDYPSLYNCIIGRTGLAQLGAACSTAHLKLKYHAKDGIIASLNGHIEAARRCFLQANKTYSSVSQSSKLVEDKEKAAASTLDANLVGSQRKTLRNKNGKRRIRSTRNFLDMFLTIIPPALNFYPSWTPILGTIILHDSTSALMIFSNPLLVPVLLRNRWHNARNLWIQVIASHIYREGNCCADYLANMGHSVVGAVWLDSLPLALGFDFFRDRSGWPNYRFP
ncbi:hypothetical protein MTR_6g075360 [Medicago truncatula]|uniref:Uncharacterized protein n=1 Tax=Medicago truncatula TaxID=3880 RepID=A0A072ULW8_MEDTR|nr:hypothetical protein MTR_6g075360 [Medicago truncatula]